jgi:hypothetical protein
LRLIEDLLARSGLTAPDGRALYVYEVSEAEASALNKLLNFRISTELRHPITAQAFVLWASEHIRTRYRGGQLTWDFVFAGLNLQPPDYPYIQWLVETGLRQWRRRVRHAESGSREFLYSLLAEGGLPDAALAEANRYGSVLLRLVSDLEAEGALATVAAALTARRHLGDLPQALRHEEQARLLADLALSLVNLRAALPEQLPRDAILHWLDANRSDWRATLPLRMSAGALEALVAPALQAERRDLQKPAAPVQRELRQDTGGSWRGLARVLDGGQLSLSLLPSEKDRRLRLTAESGASFVGQPEHGGWRLSCTSGTGVLALAPHEAVVLSAYVDGARRGDLVVDAGIPAPSEAPSLWRAADGTTEAPERLVPLSGRGQTRAPQVWVLVAPGTVPQCEGGVVVLGSHPGPDGQLWCLAGQGTVEVDSRIISIATGAEADSPQPQLAVFGSTLPGLTMAGGAPVFLGDPQAWGAEGDTPLRPLGARLRQSPLPRTLGGRMAEWIEGGIVLARARLVTLPGPARFSMMETGPGALRMTATGLPPGWHLSVSAGEAVAQAIVSADAQELSLRTQGLPGVVRVSLSDPVRGARLELSGLWPARTPRLLDSSGTLLAQDRDLSLQSLAGWRGHISGNSGAVVLRIANRTGQIGLHASGELRLAGMAPLIGQVLALAGADGRVNLRLAEGIETPRLSIGRYDWISEEAGPFRHLGLGRTGLQAIDLEDPARTSEIEATNRIDIAGWLGTGPGLWFIQARNDARGVMRPLVWAALPQPSTTRDARIARFAAMWADLLETPADAGWDQAHTLISSVRAAGDAGALDQVQALERIPAAAVVLLLMAAVHQDEAATLSLETEAPIWWPIVTCRAWERAGRAARSRIVARLTEVGMADDGISSKALARGAGRILALRPELAAHLGQALLAAELDPMALNGQDQPVPLAAPWGRLEAAAQEAARRFEILPQGTDGLRATRLTPPVVTNDGNAALMHAPLVAAEVSAGLRQGLTHDETLRLIALRNSDPIWFDAALPAALTVAFETPVPA